MRRELAYMFLGFVMAILVTSLGLLITPMSVPSYGPEAAPLKAAERMEYVLSPDSMQFTLAGVALLLSIVSALSAYALARRKIP
jgi:ABC-type antimicrobial peptide transport system permease subunit